MQLKHDRRELPNDMLTINEVARLLRVHPVTIRRWEKQSRLKSCRIGPKMSIRFIRKDISAFIAGSSKPVMKVKTHFTRRRLEERLGR